jgi:hypothetical protein
MTNYTEAGIIHAALGQVAGKGHFPPLDLRDRAAAAVHQAVVETLGGTGYKCCRWYAEAGVTVLNTLLACQTYVIQGGVLGVSPPIVSKPVRISHVWIARLHSSTYRPMGEGIYVPADDDRIAVVDLAARQLPRHAAALGSQWTAEEPLYVWDWADDLKAQGQEYQFGEIETLYLPGTRHRLSGLDIIIRRALDLVGR